MKNLITKEEKDIIDSICKEHDIVKYSINSDGSIDVNGNVKLYDHSLSEFPINFGKVSGSFDCSYNDLLSLIGSPHSVGGDFNCGHNELTSLIGAPKYIKGAFSCIGNSITTLENGPTKVDFGYYCYDNNSLTSLIGAPEFIGGDFMFGSINLVDLMGVPAYVGRDFICLLSPKLTSGYMGETDMYLGGDFNIEKANLPFLYTNNLKLHQELILKYQRYFMVWNEDHTFNEENFQILLDEIKDGLE